MIAITENQPAKTKRKRVSKKLKSSWRKHVDITDVDDFLEEQRLNERLGDYSQLSNNDLFTLDTSATEPKKLTSRQEKRQKLRNAPLKCLSALKSLKGCEAISKPNKVRTKEERMNPLIKKKQAELRAQGIFKKKDLQRVKDIQRAKERRAAKEDKYTFEKDLWADESNVVIPATKLVNELERTVKNDEWIQGDVERHIIHGPGKHPKAPPKSTHKKPYLLNAVEVPHPGMSYNPSYEDHQALLRIIAEKEEKVLKEERHLKRVTSQMFSRVTPEQRDKNWMVEMSEGLKPDVSNDAAADSDDYAPANPPVRNKEKSAKQRRKQREQTALREQQRRARVEKKKVADMYRLKFINKAIDNQAKTARVRHEKREKKKEYQKYEAKRLGSNKFEEPDLEFNMARDIKGNLRNLKKEGNLLGDRFKSLQKRNIIAPTVIKAHKKAKVKKFVRTGHKDDTWKAGVSKKLIA